MQRKTLFFQHALTLTVIAFIFHFVWENAQCRLFFVHRGLSGGWASMLLVTLGDVALTWLVQLTTAAATGRWFWSLRSWRAVEWLSLVGGALTMGVVIEGYALFVGMWSYTDANPRIPGTSVSVIPVLQLLILFPLTFGVCKRILLRRVV